MTQLSPLGAGLNAYTCTFAPVLLDEIRASYVHDLLPFLSQPANQRLFAGGRTFRRPIGRPAAYYVFSYNHYPLLWISANRNESFAIYQRFFDALQIEDALKSLVDHDHRIVMYCGFLVIGKRAPEPLWHLDYQPGANAYTLITPLDDLAPDHGQLLYEDCDEAVASYRYRLGEAILFGEGFLHSTEPYGPSAGLRVLVSLTFGTDKLAHWPALRQAVEAQSRYYVLPCGHVAGRCLCRLRSRIG